MKAKVFRHPHRLQPGGARSIAAATVRPLAAAISVALLLALALPATAQDATAADQGDEQVTTLDRMIVTAQKREEALQDVPITLSVLNEELLQDTGVRDIKDLQILVPALSVTSTGSEIQTTARLRGVGTVGDNPGLESSVGVVIDGVYRPRNGVAFGDLGELQRVEVLKGPQGTLFGKNTSAGLINIITRRPEFSRSAEGELSFGNFGALGASASYNDAIGERTAFRVYAVKRERDGLIDINTGPGPRTSDEDATRDFYSFRGQLLVEPNSDLDINFIVDYTRRDEQCCGGVTVVRGATAAIVNALAGGPGVIDQADPSRRLAYANRDAATELTDKGISMELNWQSPWFGGSTLTSITALRDWRATLSMDLDYSGADIWHRPFGADSRSVFETFSQELRLTGGNERLDWMFGLFHSSEDMRYGFPIHLGSAYEPYLSIALINNIAGSLAPLGIAVNTDNGALFLSEATGRAFGTSFAGLAQNDQFAQDATSNAAFTNLVFHATDQLDLTLGLRYTAETKTLDSSYRNPNGGAGCAAGLSDPAQIGAALAGRGVPGAAVGSVVPTVIGFMCLPWANPLFHGIDSRQKRDENEWSGSLRAAYRWNEQVMTFLSAARGYKAGGFNQDRELTATLGPDLDTAFPGEFVDAYEAGVKSSWLGGNLLLNASLFHQTYKDFQLNSFLGTSYVVRSIPRLRTRGLDADLLWQTDNGFSMQAAATWLDARYGKEPLIDAGLALLPGNRASFAPRWSTSLSMTYEHGLGSLLARYNVGARYLGDYNTGSDLDPVKLQRAYTLVNARVGIGAPNRRWALELWAQNLTNRTYQQVNFSAPLQTGSYNAFLGAPRTYGVTFRAMY